MFVCTGNICRSPTAERLARAYAASEGIADLTASSAGTRAVVGHPIQAEAATVLRNLGGDTENFAARRLTARIAEHADLILTMTMSQRDAVLELAPRSLGRTFMLTEASALATNFDLADATQLAEYRPRLAGHTAEDIPDPIGRSLEFYTETGSLIAQLLPSILRICKSAES